MRRSPNTEAAIDGVDQPRPDSLAGGAQQPHGARHGQSVATPSAGTRQEAFKCVLLDKGLCERIGSAWRLFFNLLVIEEGVIVGTYEQIGEKLGVGANTARNWVNAMESQSLVTKKSQGRAIEIFLVEPFLSKSSLPEQIAPVIPSPVPISDSPRLARLRAIDDAAAKIEAHIEIKLVI
jgi:hypothetical protein